jgi:hypothetical protein
VLKCHAETGGGQGHHAPCGLQLANTSALSDERSRCCFYMLLLLHGRLCRPPLLTSTLVSQRVSSGRCLATHANTRWAHTVAVWVGHTPAMVKEWVHAQHVHPLWLDALQLCFCSASGNPLHLLSRLALPIPGACHTAGVVLSSMLIEAPFRCACTSARAVPRACLMQPLPLFIQCCSSTVLATVCEPRPYSRV